MIILKIVRIFLKGVRIFLKTPKSHIVRIFVPPQFSISILKLNVKMAPEMSGYFD